MDEVDLIICRVDQIRSGSGWVFIVVGSEFLVVPNHHIIRLGWIRSGLDFFCNFHVGSGLSGFGSKFLAHA